MTKERTYQVIKRAGEEAYDVISNDVTTLFGTRTRRLGTITYNSTKEQYTYKQVLLVMYPNGSTQELHRTIGITLEELNK